MALSACAQSFVPESLSRAVGGRSDKICSERKKGEGGGGEGGKKGGEKSKGSLSRVSGGLGRVGACEMKQPSGKKGKKGRGPRLRSEYILAEERKSPHRQRTACSRLMEGKGGEAGLACLLSFSRGGGEKTTRNIYFVRCQEGKKRIEIVF